MSYLSATLNFCLLLFPTVGVMLGSTAASAEDKLALSFDLPPAQVATHLLVRYQDSLPPISPTNVGTLDVAVTAIEVIE